MKVNKTGAVTIDTILNFIIAIVLIVVLLFVGAILLPIFANSSDKIADTGYTGTELFDSTNGVMVFILVVVLLLVVIVALFALIKGAMGKRK